MQSCLSGGSLAWHCAGPIRSSGGRTTGASCWNRIRLHGPTTRGDIAEPRRADRPDRLDHRPRTRRAGLRPLRRARSRRGRGLPPATLRINPEGGYAVGIHVTPLGIDAALINLARRRGRAARYRDAPERHARPGLRADRRDGRRTDRRCGPAGRLLGIGLALPGPFDVESMSFVGPTTMAGWKNVALRERLAEATGLPAFFETDMAAAALGERLYGLGAAVLRVSTTSISASASAAPWCMTAACCAAPGAMPARSATSRSCPTASLPLRQPRLPRALSLARGASPLARHERGRLGRARSRRSSAMPSPPSRISSIPQTIVLGGLASDRPAASGWQAATDDLPNSVSARRDRTTPRVIVSQRRPAFGAARRGGPCGFRGAVAALRPDVRRRARPRRDLLQPRGWRHERTACWCSTTSPRTTAPSKR